MAAAPASWTFREQDFRRIQLILEGFLHETKARCALLVDRAGQLMLSAGEQPEFDSTAFSSLAAADFSANDQLASIIGEGEFSSLVHQGEKESLYLADIGKRVILITLFDNRTTLGMIRIKAKRIVRELSAVVDEMFAERAAQPSPPLEAGFADEAESEIDRLFREA